MTYINPYVLLSITGSSLPNLDPKTVARYKTKLFHEIELSDTSSVYLNGVEVSKADCLRVIDELDNDNKKEFHQFIFQNKSLNDFLTNGNLSFFKSYRAESIYKLSEFIAFISPYFSNQYDKQLVQYFKSQNIENTKLLLSIKPIVNTTYNELCYKSTYLIIKQIDSEIINITSDINNKSSIFIDAGFEGLVELVKKKVSVSVLNVLPNYFGSVRNQLAQTVRNLARDINNEPFENYKVAYQLIEIAHQLNTEGLVNQTITKGYYTIKNNYVDSLIKEPELGVVSKPTPIPSNPPIIDTVGKKEEKNSSAIIYYTCFLLASSSLLAWALFNSTTQKIIIYIATAMYVIWLYNFIKKKDIESKKSKGQSAIYGISFIVCLGSYYYPFLGVLFISYFLVLFTHSFFSMAFFRKTPNAKWGFGYLLIAWVIVFLLSVNQEEETAANSIRLSNDNTTESVVQQSSGNNISTTPNVTDTASNSAITAPTDNLLSETEPTYTPVFIQNGNIPNCSSFTPKYNYKLNNKLVISVSMSDAAVKLVSQTTNRCIRFVFIKNGTTYTLKNIPEGLYYLKIAYGENWSVKTGDLVCKGHFTSNALYKRGDEILNYNIIRTTDGYRIPSFSLSLSTTYTDDNSERFNTNQISSTDFSND